MATTSPIILPIETPGLKKIKDLEKRMEALEKDVNKLNRSLPRTANNIQKTGRAAATATANVQRFGVAFRSTILPITAVYGALNLFSSALKVATERASDVSVLTNGLKKLGATEADLAALSKQADAFDAATLFDSEDFIAGAAVLTSFTDVAIKDYKRLIAISADVAQTNKGPLKDSLLQVAKALNAPEIGLTALSRSGIQFTDAQKETVKALVETGNKALAQELILKELEKQYGNNSKAAATGLAGAQDSLSKSFRDFQEVIGKGVMPVVEELVVEATKLFRALSKLDPKLIQNATRAAKFAAKMGLVLTAVKAVAGLKGAIVGMLTATATSATTAGNASATAADKVSLLASRLKALAAIGIVTVGVEYIVRAGQAGASLEDELKKLENGGTGALFAGASRETVLKAKETARQSIAAINKELQQLKQPNLLQSLPGIGPVVAGQTGARIQTLLARKANAQSVLNLDPDKFFSQAEKDAAELKALEDKINAALAGYDDGKGKGNNSASDAEQRAAQALQQRLQNLNIENNLKADVLGIQEKINAAEAAGDKQLAIRLNGDKQILAITAQTRKALIGVTDEQERINILRGSALDIANQQLLTENQLANAVQKTGEELSHSEKIVQDLTNQVGGQLMSAIDGLIQGTEDWNSVLTNTLRTLSSVLLKAGINALGGGDGVGFFSILSGNFGGGRAEGGSVVGGTTYLVGEQGPELFTPGSSGNITPNSALGGEVNVITNINVEKGTSTSSTSGTGAKEAAQLARMMENATLAVINRERRPGGVLSK